MSLTGSPQINRDRAQGYDSRLTGIYFEFSLSYRWLYCNLFATLFVQVLTLLYEGQTLKNVVCVNN